MRVSLIQLNLMAEDAIGACTIQQVRFFRQRGDDIHVFTQYPSHDLPPDIQAVTSAATLEDLVSGREAHFRLSDLYVCHYPGYYELLESIRGIDRGLVVFYYHNVTPPELWGSDADRELLERSVQGRSLIHYADLCITDSPFNKQDLVEQVGYDANLISVLPLAVTLDDIRPSYKNPELARRYQIEGKNVLLFVGRMAGNKRIDLLVEALALVKDQIPDSSLLLVGDNQDALAYREVTTRARNRAIELGIEQDVIFTGRVPKVDDYYGLADVYVTASLHEGFGVPLIEAMACGVPIVASRSGAMPWVIGEAGLLCEPGDATDLAAKVLQVLTDRSLRLDLIQKGFDRARCFGMQQYEAGFAAIIDKAVAYTLPEIQVRPGSWATANESLPPASTFPQLPVEGSSEVATGLTPQLGPTVLRDVRELAWVNPHLPIAWPYWPKGLWPKVVALLQKVIRRLLRWYINPLIEQQNQFNAAVVRALGELENAVLRLQQEQTPPKPDGDADSE